MIDPRTHIDVLFDKMAPAGLLEAVLPRSKHRGSYRFVQNELSVHSVSLACYLHFVRGLSIASRRTDDELIQRWRELDGFLRTGPTGGIFSLLSIYAETVLNFSSGEPKCRQEYVLEWRERTLTLGQDIFTCSGLAAKDVREGCTSLCFEWLPAVRTDYADLAALLKSGVSENHYHLVGSTQIFPLTWGYLMNHPSRIRQYFCAKEFRENLHPRTSFGQIDNEHSWVDYLYDAAWIRQHLFRTMTGQADQKSEYIHSLDHRKYLIDAIEVLRLFGARLEQENGAHCLDYVITNEIYNANRSAYRFLSGERSFLYNCFLRCYSGEFDEEKQNLFYLYLLIKLSFRKELIQANSRRGFFNFASYQDRKSLIWGQSVEYWSEANRIAIAGPLEQNEWNSTQINSLELRIKPGRTRKRLRNLIWNTDQTVEYQLGPDRPDYFDIGNIRRLRMENAINQDRYFYVIHFIKTPLRPVMGNEIFLEARNHDVRTWAEREARLMARALERSSYLCGRIRGIDACSFEIGCRPETFATVFRYLKSFCPFDGRSWLFERYWPRLGCTYHAGEDFLDITDGLRAIDEAVCFLNMERGDRLGHALALGADPDQYYRVKDGQVFLPAQDLLDNLVWLLRRSLEWGVVLDSELRNILCERAEALLRVIYSCDIKSTPQHTSVSLRDYYKSWMLRGDDPKIYSDLVASSDDGVHILAHYRKGGAASDPYLRAALDERLRDYDLPNTARTVADIERGDALRLNPSVMRLVYLYHFGLETRLRGQQIERFDIPPRFSELIREMQNALMDKLNRKGISIECNPSSNKLIGTFDKYELHPIFRFNGYGLSKKDSASLHVSVNTDDQGIFDTLLENEYALIYGALQAKADATGKRLYDDNTIHSYMVHLSHFGNDMVFPKATKSLRRKNR